MGHSGRPRKIIGGAHRRDLTAMQSGQKYRADIDGLRATAVIAVVLYHAFPKLLPGGFVGVDVFFVISGYLITQIIVNALDAPQGFSFPDFYSRRIQNFSCPDRGVGRRARNRDLDLPSK